MTVFKLLEESSVVLEDKLPVALNECFEEPGNVKTSSLKNGIGSGGVSIIVKYTHIS